MFYTVWKGKRLYLQRKLFSNERAAKFYVCMLLREQDAASPHRYQKDGFEVTVDDVVLDGGAAEGFFALDCVDTAKKVILAEPDEDWIEALEKTFEPYKDKVIIVRKFLSNKSNNVSVKIDDISENITFVKLDIEGYEKEAIIGGKGTLSKVGTRAIVCTYHKAGDDVKLGECLVDLGMRIEYQDGYMTCPMGFEPIPELRHGVVFGEVVGNDRCFNNCSSI